MEEVLKCVACKKCGEECNSNPDSLVAGCPDYEGKLEIDASNVSSDNDKIHYICMSCAKYGEEGLACKPNAGYFCTGWVSNVPPKEKEQKKDAVNHPDHYTQGGIECIDCIRASMSKEGFEDYCKGNVIKYLHRWRFKGGVQDLRKAEVYLMWLIQSAEKEDNEKDI